MFCVPSCFSQPAVLPDDVAPVVEEGAAPLAVGAGDGGEGREWYQVRVDENLSLQASGHCKGGDPKLSPPGLALATVTVATGEGGKPVARARMGCGGIRQCGKAGNKCETKDLWHLGSDGKAMTSMLCAIFVDKGIVSWDTTVGECEDVVTGQTNEQYLNVTLKQLLTHTAGFMSACSGPVWNLAYEQHASSAEPREQRVTCLSALLTTPPQVEPGTQHIYSNWGYAMAGHMLEYKMNASYESLVGKYLFNGLGITTFGFGSAPGVTNPWGHGEYSKWKPISPEELGSDNPTALNPAGRIHMSIGDWCRFIAASLSPALANELLGVTNATMRALRTPPVSQEYAPGAWLVVSRGWAKGNVLTHGGSNTLNHCVAWLAPDGLTNPNTPIGAAAFGAVVCCNSGAGLPVLDLAVGELIRAT